MRDLTPTTMPAPFGRYAHGVAVPPGARWLATSGQLPMRPDGMVPEGARAQAELCLAHVEAILTEGGMGPRDVVRLTAFVTDREHMAGYMAARDAWIAPAGRTPASTLLIVTGFTRPEFLVEVEALAARVD